MEKGTKTSNLTRGMWGERKAAEYFKNKGYLLLERNFRCRIGEIDIVAKDGDFLVFAEVKTRTRMDKGLPGQFIDQKKMKRIIKSAEYYVLWRPELRKYQPRFDVVELLATQGGVYIRHIKNAFS